MYNVLYICIQQGVLKLCRNCPCNFWGNTLWVYNIHILLPEILLYYVSKGKSIVHQIKSVSSHF